MSKSRSRPFNRRVVYYSNANRRLPIDVSLPASVQSVFGTRLSLPSIEDRRTFHPDGPLRPARSVSKLRHRLVTPRPHYAHVSNPYAPRLAKFSSPAVAAFYQPRRVLVCVRRRRRKEVLHALRKTGLIGQRIPRWNYLSTVSC